MGDVSIRLEHLVLALLHTGRYGIHMEHTSKEVADRVAAAIARQGVTQRAVAEATSIPLTTFHRSVTGRRPFTITELFLIADALSVSVNDLLPERKAA